MNNKSLLIASMIVVTIVGLYFMYSGNVSEAQAEQTQAAVEQEIQPEVPAQPEPVVAQAETAPVEETQPEPVQESLGASSSGLGR